MPNRQVVANIQTVKQSPMDLINILPDYVANQIAAGEVVDRPAGAVKELLENALDASASQIDLVLKDAGRTLIQVIDNGCGMSDGDACRCFERHATSKIHHADDLFAIHTMGFRGEALASIAAIAQVELRTRQPENDMGTLVLVEGGRVTDRQPVACKSGTSISVKNLFYNVPARRNFLKKDSVEMSHIEEVFRRVALIHHEVAFSLSAGGRPLYNLPAGSLMQRIAGLYGNVYKERLFAVDEETDLVRIHGFVSRPEYSRKTRGEQYLFVNGRFIKHPALSAAVEKAYTDLLPDHSYPSYFIGLQVDPSKIDINIHPSKIEVKFVDEHALFAILRSAVKRALGQFSLATEFSFDTPPEFNIAPAAKGYTPPQPRLRYNPDYDPFRAVGSRAERPVPMSEAKPVDSPAPALLPDMDISTPQPPIVNGCLQVQGKYIVTSLSSGLAIINQHRAHERVLYDRLRRSQETPAAPQTLMFPIQCHFSAADAELLGELLPDLQHLGFEMSPIGQCTFVVSAVPSDMKESDMQPLLERMLNDYKGSTMQKFSKRDESLCASLARQMAIKEGTTLDQEQMQQLVADLFACPLAEVSPSGKRTITIVKPEEVLK